MKKPKPIFTFVSEQVNANLESLEGTSLNVDVVIILKDQYERLWSSSKVVRCKLRKVSTAAPVAEPVVEEIVQ